MVPLVDVRSRQPQHLHEEAGDCGWDFTTCSSPPEVFYEIRTVFTIFNKGTPSDLNAFSETLNEAEDSKGASFFKIRKIQVS